VNPVGAWFSQVGRLHQVHHLWQYAYVRPLYLRTVKNLKHFISSDLKTRKDLREKAWELDGWSETVSKVIFTNEILGPY
jgi:NIPSNAP